MKDCHIELTDYHEETVRLPKSKSQQLTARRDANRSRLCKGLESKELPLPETFIVQGSRAMKTTIQELNDDYDIDDGVEFSAEDLLGPNGAELSALGARKRVRDAVDDGSFKQAPEVKTNCVRIYYNDGPHVDQPVYRRHADGRLEIASADWKESDPNGVTDWFERRLLFKVGDGAASQMRALIRLLKAYCKNGRSVSLPSGFALTVLIEEAFHVYNGRIDVAFRNVIAAIHSRLQYNLVVAHPIVTEPIVGSGQENLTRNLRDELEGSLASLAELDKSTCTKAKALKIWKEVFRTDHFDKLIEAAENDSKASATQVVASLGASAPRQWGSR